MEKKKKLKPLNTNIPSATLNKSKRGEKVNSKLFDTTKENACSTISKFNINFDKINKYMQNNADDVHTLGNDDQSSVDV